MAGDGNRLLRKEVESLNARLRKFNQENDDLLQRLSDLKFQKERREEEFEQEKLNLRTRIRDLERGKLDLDRQLNSVRRELEQNGSTKQQQASRDDEQSARQVERLRQEHVRKERELLERLNSIRVEKEATERAWKKQVDQLKVTVQSKLKSIEEMRLENDRLMARTLPVEEERRLRQEVTEMTRVMEAEARELKHALRENEELRKGFDGRNEGMRLRMDELNETLRLKERELDEARRQIVRIENTRNAVLSSKEKEISLSREIERLTAMVEAKQKLLEEATKDLTRLRRAADLQLNHCSEREKRLEQEVDRLNSMLTLKERQLLDTTNDRQRLQEEMVSLKGVACIDREGQTLRNEVDRLTTSVRSKEVLLEESLAKNRELSAVNEQLDRDLRETRSFLKRMSDTNQELVDKNLKLERALAKTKADSGQGSSEKQVSPYLRTLLKEQESHIEDLQRQVGTIRSTIMDNSKTKQLAILAAEIEPDDDKDTIEGGEGILRELKQAKRNLNFSQRRISQLENWLDEIYTTTDVIGGGQGSSVGRPKKGRQRLSVLTGTSKRTAAMDVLTLPGIADFDENTIERTYSNLRSNRRTNANRITRPSWNITTSTS